MTTRDLVHMIEPAASLDPAVRATGTHNGTGVDMQGYNSACMVVQFGAYTNGTHTPSLEHSDDNSSFSAVSAAELDGAFTAINSSGAVGTVQKVGYRGSKRYLRAVMVVASGATGAASSATIARAHGSAINS